MESYAMGLDMVDKIAKIDYIYSLCRKEMFPRGLAYLTVSIYNDVI